MCCGFLLQVSQLTSALEQSKQSNADLKEKVEECLRKIRDSKEDQANIEEQLRKELVSKVRGRRGRREGGREGGKEEDMGKSGVGRKCTGRGKVSGLPHTTPSGRKGHQDSRTPHKTPGCAQTCRLSPCRSCTPTEQRHTRNTEAARTCIPCSLSLSHTHTHTHTHNTHTRIRTHTHTHTHAHTQKHTHEHLHIIAIRSSVDTLDHLWLKSVAASCTAHTLHLYRQHHYQCALFGTLTGSVCTFKYLGNR